MGNSALPKALAERLFGDVGTRPATRSLSAGLLAAGLLLTGVFTACSGGGSSGPLVPGFSGKSTRLAEVHYGLLADVYGLQATPTGTTIELFEKDVMVGPDIKDERPANSTKPDNEILYDFLSADPDTLQPRLLITRVIGSPEFNAAVQALDDSLRLVQPGVFGQNTNQQPFSVVARNAALRLTFTRDLGLTEDFFVQRDPNTGQITGIKNSEAVQLLEITADPKGSAVSKFRQIPTRIVPRKNVLILDPVLLGSEGLQYNTRNNASGMPESADQVGGNIRLAVALEGPLAIPGVRPDPTVETTGINNTNEQSVIRDFRSGNRNDNSPDISQGFLRDPIPPSIVGQIVMYVERVDPLDEFTEVVTLYKNGINHEIDRGDTIRLMIDNSGIPAAVTEVTVDPADDLGMPAVQHVRTIVRRVLQTNAAGQQVDVFEANDPSRLPGYPSNIAEREKWLVANAPRAVLVAEFTAERRDPSGNLYGDDPRYFVTFTPAPLPSSTGVPSAPTENVSPFAGAIIRFSKPVDIATVRALDTYFFATRDLTDKDAITQFQTENNIDPGSFILDKFITPHLVAAQVFDEDGSQTSLRLQPKLGFYLDQRMRDEDDPLPFAQKKFRYYLHVIGGANGIRDLSGNPIDFQSEVSVKDDVTFPFSLDTRETPGGQPLFPDNLVVTVARRFANPDEDEQPSYYVPEEVQRLGASYNNKAYNLPDVFGSVVYLSDGTLTGRPTARVRQAVDDINQNAPPPQGSVQEWCPAAVGTEPQVASSSAGAKFGQPLQNPLNPFGCRLQTVWRELDMNLSKTDPLDFDLDVEQMFWAPFTAIPVVFDEFDQMSLYLGHAEYRPEPCVGASSSLPTLPQSGLVPTFDDNYVFNPNTTGGRENPKQAHAAYEDQVLQILPNQAVTEVNGVYRYLPLPQFKKPYFVWRDERVKEQGADSAVGFDTQTNRSGNFTPYILSPFLAGQGRYVTQSGNGPVFNNGFWDNRHNWNIAQSTRPETESGGLVGSIALPLLADFWVIPDDPTKPLSNPFRASGANGWQIALAVQSSPLPNFRVYSAGGIVQQNPRTVDPTTSDWTSASGGYTPNGARTRNGDNTVFWVMADYLKRMSVMTAGFVDIWDPHRIQAYPAADPRLGPFYDPDPSAPAGSRLPSNVLPRYEVSFEPPLQNLPPGTAVLPEYRGAGPVDPKPWAAIENGYVEPPDWKNVPLDPLKAGDAHIRKYDDRAVNGSPRDWWTYYYQRNVTDYTSDLNDLREESFVTRFAGPNDSFLPNDVRYFNYRLIFQNNVEASPPVTPRIDSMTISYRFEQQN